MLQLSLAQAQGLNTVAGIGAILTGVAVVVLGLLTFWSDQEIKRHERDADAVAAARLSAAEEKAERVESRTAARTLSPQSVAALAQVARRLPVVTVQIINPDAESARLADQVVQALQMGGTTVDIHHAGLLSGVTFTGVGVSRRPPLDVSISDALIAAFAASGIDVGPGKSLPVAADRHAIAIHPKGVAD